MKKISICITYYNQKEFVKDSLNSVLAIDFPCDYEILVGDDGSNDGTVEVVNEYKNKYPDKIKLFIMDREENSKSIGRASLNRLNLVQNATGDFIMFLDGDDYYCDKNFIINALNVFEKDDKIVACAFKYKMLFEDGQQIKVQLPFKSGYISIKKYIRKYYNHCGAFVFKNIFTQNKNDKVNFLRGINGIFDDNGITLYFLQFGTLYYMDEYIYIYRQSENSLWNRCSELEKAIINASYLKPLLLICSKYKYYIIKRTFKAIRSVWKNRNKISEVVSKDFYNKYCGKAKDIGDYFLYNILVWQKIETIEKIKCFFKYFYYKIIKRFV